MVVKANAVLFFMLLAISSVSFAAEANPGVSPYLFLFPLALMITISVVSLVFIIAHASGNAMLEAWAKVELQEVFISAILGVLILAAVESANSAVYVLTGQPDYIVAAQATLNSQLNRLGTVFGNLVNLNYYVSKAAGFSYSNTLGLMYFSKTSSNVPAGGVSPLSVAISGALDQVSLAMMITEVQELFLLFFSHVVPIFVLPIALVLRAFPVTRKLGAALIAISLGLLIAFPFGVLLGGAVYSSITDRSGSPLSDENVGKIDGIENSKGVSDLDIGSPPASSFICSPAILYFSVIGDLGWSLIICIPLQAFGVPFGGCSKVVSIVYLAISSIFQLAMSGPLQQYVRDISWAGFFDTVSNSAMPAVSLAVMLSVVLSLLVIIITVVATRSMATALGGEGQIYGLSKLV